jgi:hypothetical protein
VALIGRLFGVLLAVAAGLCAFAFWDRYWRWRDCFNELGRCYAGDPPEVFLEQAGLVWGGFTVILLGLALLLLWPRGR